MAFGVQANASTQCQWFCVAVEYRLRGQKILQFTRVTVILGVYGSITDPNHVYSKPLSKPIRMRVCIHNRRTEGIKRIHVCHFKYLSCANRNRINDRYIRGYSLEELGTRSTLIIVGVSLTYVGAWYILE